MRASVCLRVKLVLLFSRGCFGRQAGASDGKLASDWHSHGFSRWPFTQKAFFHSVLNFSQSLLNTLRPLPPSICLCVCVCVFLCFVCSLMILQPRNHLLFWTAAGYGYVPDSRVFFDVHVFNVGVLGEKSVWSSSILVMLFFFPLVSSAMCLKVCFYGVHLLSEMEIFSRESRVTVCSRKCLK